MIRNTVVALVFAVNGVALSGAISDAVAHNGKNAANSTQVASAAVKARLSTCSTYPCPAGFTWYYFNDATCPGNPDTYEAYVEYWNADASFNHDVYGGTASFAGSCTAPSGTFGSSSEYTTCINTSPWNCLQLGVSQTPHPNSQWNTP